MVGGSGGGFVVHVGPESTYLMFPGVVWSRGGGLLVGRGFCGARGVGLWWGRLRALGDDRARRQETLRALPVGTYVVRSRL